MTDENKKTDEQILFPDRTVTIDGKEMTLKPWKLGDLIKINPILEAVFIKLEEKGTKIDLENFNVNIMKDIYFAAMPQVANLIVASTELNEDEVNNLSVEDALGLIMVIFTINMDSFRSFLNLFFIPNQNVEQGLEEEVKGQD